MKKDTTADIWFENAPGSFLKKDLYQEAVTGHIIDFTEKRSPDLRNAYKYPWCHNVMQRFSIP